MSTGPENEYFPFAIAMLVTAIVLLLIYWR